MSYESLCRLLGRKLHLVSGNRRERKDLYRLGRLLFDFDDGRLRQGWEDLLYIANCTSVRISS
jgi:hypothetical protein